VILRRGQFETGHLITTLSGHRHIIGSVAFSPDGTTLATTSFDATVKLWDAKTGHLITTLTEHEHTVGSVAFSPDGTTLATASDDSTAKIWQVGD
jgi:WD40 repeat protein